MCYNVQCRDMRELTHASGRARRAAKRTGQPKTKKPRAKHASTTSSATVPEVEEEPVIGGSDEGVLPTSSGSAPPTPGVPPPPLSRAPFDDFIIKTYGDHIASKLWVGGARDSLVLKTHNHSHKLSQWLVSELPFSIVHVLKQTGFIHIAHLAPIELARLLLAAFVKRWFPEVNTEHFKIITPVSICMFLVVVLVTILNSDSSSLSTIAYNEDTLYSI